MSRKQAPPHFTRPFAVLPLSVSPAGQVSGAGDDERGRQMSGEKRPVRIRGLAFASPVAPSLENMW